MTTKSEIDGPHPASNYLVATDQDDTSTWHLRVRDTNGRLDRKLMGDAWAALHGGFRGNDYGGPNKQGAIRKLIELYHSQGMALPGVKNRAGEKLVVYNRSEPDGQWIHIVPKGELPNSGANVVQVLDDKALNKILASIEKDRLRLGEENWPGIYGGREHFIYNDDKDSEALAWFKDFQLRDDGIWADAAGLTPIGRQAVQNRQYKYTSFVADRGDLEHVEGNRYRVNKIETVGFTNMANGKDLLKPIMNRAPGSPQLAERGQRTNEAGLEVPVPAGPSGGGGTVDTEWDAALEKWFSAVANIISAGKAHAHVKMSFPAAWNLCAARNPELYHEAFGCRYTEDRAAQSDAEAQQAAQDLDAVTNRLQRASGMDFRCSWNFVREHLPLLFNRRFNGAQRARIGKELNADNYAGVQKRAQKHYLDLVLQEQERYGIPGIEAFRRVANREPELKALAGYEIKPAEAFRRAPALESKLLNRPAKPLDDAEMQRRAKALFDKMVTSEQEGKRDIGNAGLFGAYRKLMNREPVLCDLLNKKITPAEAFRREPSLRERLEKVYVPR